MMKQLFDMVENNNYIELKQLISVNPNINLNLRKSSKTLLYESVLYRAKECFDILVDLPSIKLYEESITYNSALHKAIQYYMNAKNENNRYYIDQLIEKGYASHNMLRHCVSDRELFFYLFDKSDKSKLQVLTIIYASLSGNYMYSFECMLHSYLVLNINGDTMIGTNIKLTTLNEIIAKDNMGALEIFMKFGSGVNSLKEYNFLLYIAANNESINTFNYFYDYYSKLTIEELNNIPQAKNIENLFSLSSNSDVKLKMVDKILKLKLNFNVEIALVSMYLQSLNLFSAYSKTILDKSGYEIMTLIFENKKVLTNPILQFQVPMFSKAISRTFTTPALQTRFNNMVAKFFDICLKYNYKPTDEILALLDKHKIPIKL